MENKSKGITLVALVITIVILLILSAVVIRKMTDGGIIAKAQKTIDEYKKTEQDGGNSGSGVEVTLANGSKVILTKDNFGQYLGKKVTNYKTVGGTESVEVGSSNYTFSTTYRLYYIDFDNKFKDGAGTVYLKADCTSNNYNLPMTDISFDTAENIKIRNLNPELYKPGVTPPKSINSNMKAVTWLTNTNNWEGLVTSGASTEIGSKVNYIVGAPSLEMMMDGFNTHYNLTNATPDNTERTETSPRTRLFYKYPYNSSNYGYGVGPTTNSKAVDGYYTNTSNYTVQTDSQIDSMYWPGSNQYYWLASPSSSNDIAVMFVLGGNVNNVDYSNFNHNRAFCPLVSLQSSVQLKLSD